MLANIQAYAAGGGRHPLFWPLLISFTGHLLLFGSILYPLNLDSKRSFMPSIIDVHMVDLKDAVPAPAGKSTADKAPVAEKPQPAKAKVSAAQKKAAAKAEVSIAKPRKKAKVALKYKTFKSKEVLKKALQRLEKKVDTAPPKPLQDTIKHLRDKVDKEGRPEGATESATKGTAVGKTGGFAHGSRQEIETIDIYRAEVAYQINANWAFSEQLAGTSRKLVASVVFKIMPNGMIEDEDTFFTDRSGNQYLDDSAIKAIKKSSPVKAHPEGLTRPYVEMGINFTPEGVQ